MLWEITEIVNGSIRTVNWPDQKNNCVIVQSGNCVISEQAGEGMQFSVARLQNYQLLNSLKEFHAEE
jgi:hypothetical protein